MIKSLLGPSKRRRIAGMFANIAQLIGGAAFVSYFFKGGSWLMQIAALFGFLGSFIFAILFEPENGGS